MENKDLMIYNAVANVAARVFASFDGVMFQPGKYDVPAVLNRLKSVKSFQDENAETAANEIVKIEIDSFTCSFRAVDSFDLLKRLAAAYQIPTACRATFTKKAETAPVAVSFRVFAGMKDICSRAAKNDTLHPCFNYICVDTKRRALIVCDQYTLSAVPVPEMYVSQDAKENYLITPAVLKAGKGICNIDINGVATNGAAVSAVDENIKYPNIARVLFAVSSEFITLGKKAFSELKKNVSAVAKFGKSYNTPVILKADAGANEIEIIGYRENETETAAPRETRRVAVAVPQPVPFAFCVAVAADRLGKVLSAEKMYLKNPNAPVCFVDETRRVFSVMYPGKDLYHTPFFNSAFEIPVPAAALSVDAVAGTFAHVQDAPAVPFEDEETAPAVAADSAQETAANITYITPAYVPVIDEEIKNAVIVAAEYKYLDYRINMFGTRSRREHTPAVRAAELLLQRENLRIESYALICGNGKTFAYISKHDEEIKVNYDVQETAAPVDEETANVETPAVQDEETPAVAADSETAAVFAKVDEYTVNDKNGNAVIFGTYAPQLGTDEETAQETPANVQDEETAPAVAVSLPVPCFEETKHAVYLDGVLHGVYFSKLLADAVLFDAFFAGRSVYPLQLSANETAPQTERAAVAVAVSQDEETRRNIETAAAAYLDENYTCTDEELRAAAEYLKQCNISIRRRRVYYGNTVIANITLNIENGAAVAVAVEYLPAADIVPADSETPAVAAEDAQETAPAVQDEETPAVDEETAAAVFASVWACMPEIWETDAPVADSVPAAEDEETANAEDEETANVETAAPVAVLINSRRRSSLRPWLIRAAAVFAVLLLSVFANWERETPAVAVPAVFAAPAAAVQDEETDAPAADSETAAAVQETPAVAAAVPVADKQPQRMKKRPHTAKETAPAVAADSVKQFAAVAVADSVPADSVYFAADSVLAVPADSVPAVNKDTPQTAKKTAAAVQDEETDAPAADSETAAAVQETPAADSVPAAAVAGPGCPAVPAVQCAPAAPVVPVAPIVIACF